MRLGHLPTSPVSISTADRLRAMGVRNEAFEEIFSAQDEVKRALLQLFMSTPCFSRDLTAEKLRRIFGIDLSHIEQMVFVHAFRQSLVNTSMGLLQGIRPELDDLSGKEITDIAQRFHELIDLPQGDQNSLYRLVAFHDVFHWAVARYLKLDKEPTFLCGPDRLDEEYRELRQDLPPQLTVYCHSQTLFEEMLVALWGGQKIEGRYSSLFRAVMDKEQMLAFRDWKIRRGVDGGELQEQILDEIEAYDAEDYQQVLDLYKKIALLYAYFSVMGYVQSRPHLHQYAYVVYFAFHRNADWLLAEPLPALDQLARPVFEAFSSHGESRILFEMFQQMMSGELTVND